jgi:hypothetical protein
MRTLAEAALDASTCTKCRLSQGRTQVVYGVGDPSADLMFIGEAPGFHEDKQGEPFVGAAGQLLNQLLSEIEIPRSDVYINNVILCRPPGNRDPLPDELDACKPWLDERDRDHRSRGGRDARELGDPVHPGTAGLDQPRARSAVPLERPDRHPHVPSGGGAPRRRPGLQPDDRAPGRLPGDPCGARERPEPAEEQLGLF